MRKKYYFTGITAVIETLLYCGIIYGWSSLSYAFSKDGFFNASCNASTSNLNKDGEDCPSQEEQLNLVFTIASVVSSVSTLGSGYILDKFGTRVLRGLCSILYTGGFLINGFVTYQHAFVLYITMTMIACAGFGLLMTNIPVGNLFRNHRGFVITFINGAYDSSAVIFALVKLGYDHGVALGHIFHFISASTLLVVARTFFLMPRYHISYDVPEDFNYGVHEGCCCCSRRVTEEEEEETELLISQTPPSTSLKSLLLNSSFMLNVYFVGTLQMRNQFFYGTLDPWLKSMLSDDNSSTQSKYINVFGITQLFGIFVAPLNGILIDAFVQKFPTPQTESHINNRKAVAISLGVTSLLATLFSVLVIIPVLPLQYVSFVVQVTFRSFLYGSFSSFLITCYPNHHFGKLYGATVLFAACISALQFPLFYIVERYFSNDFFVINIVLLCVSLSTVIHPVALYFKSARVGYDEDVYENPVNDN